MIKFRRGISLFLTLTLVGTLALTGCGKSNNASSDLSVSTDSANKASGTETKTIRVYTWESSLKTQNEAVIKAFEDKNPGIRVELQYPVENDNVEYTRKVDLLLLSGEKIDAMFESSVANLVAKVNRKMYQPLDSFIQKEGISYDSIYNVSSKVNSSYYGLPMDISPWFVMINKKMLDDAGLPVPPLDWTWNDYREYARKLTKGEGQTKIYGSYFHTFQNFGLFGVYSTKMDNAYYKEDGSLNFDDPNLKGWLQFRFDMENKDKTSVPLMDIKTSKLAYRNEFFGGKAAMVPIGAWMFAEIKDTTKWPHDFQTTFAALPKWGDTGVAGRTFSDTKMWSIPKSAANPEEAYKFIRYYTTEGAYIRAGGLTAEKNMDMKTIIPKIVGDSPDKLYDMNSIYSIFDNPKLQYNAPRMVPSYNAQIDTMFVSEMEKYLVGGETIDQCISNLDKQGNDIVAKSK